MAKTDQIQIRVSAEDKEKARKVFADCGYTLSAACRLFIERTAKGGRMPFNIEAGVDSSASSDRA